MVFVIRDARLIDGTGGAPVERSMVIVEGDRISAAGSADDVRMPTGEATVIEAEGCTVMPALIDVHASITKLPPAMDVYGVTEKNIGASIARAVANCRRYLDVGVTTLRVDTSSSHGIFGLKEAIDARIVDGPRLLVPGRGICITGGHGWDVGCHEADGADGVRRAARLELRAGADWIKLMATGGAGSPNERVEDNQMTLEEISAAVEEAHKKGKFAFAHVTCSEGARNCIAAGIDSIEHGLFLEEDVVRSMAEHGVFLVPTLGVYRRLIDLGPKGLVPAYKYQKALKLGTSHAESFRRALRAGVKIAVGTDAGSDYHPAGESALYELELMREEGMAPMDVLVAATSRGAELLRLQDALGTLEVGKLADILVVEGNPLEDMRAIRNTRLVLKEGQAVLQRAFAGSPGPAVVGAV